MNDSTPQGIPAAVRRNHWMNQLLTHAAMKPDDVAFKYQGVSTTWRQAADEIDLVAAALQRRGVRFGDRVLILTMNHVQAIEAIFAINRLGAIAVPVNVRLSPAELAYIVDDAESDVVFVDEVLTPLLDGAGSFTDRAQQVIVIGAPGDGRVGFADLLAEPLDGFEAPDVPESSTALIMYTSGTTGRAKGVMLDHINLFSQALTCLRTYEMKDESDVALLTAPVFHIASLGLIAAHVVIGIPSVLHPLGAFDPVALLDAYEREKATIVFNVPQQWQAICAVPDIDKRSLHLRIISWGAAPASEAILRTMGETFPDALNVAAFGQTEMTPTTCVMHGEDSLRKIGSVGKALPTVQYRIVDADMNDVGVHEVGEIVYRGPNLMQGYWNKPAETAEAFAGGWFHSGDLVRQDEEGFIWVVDRLKDMIISGGENIYSVEVESALLAHPDIVDAAVYGRPDEKWGEVPVAVVVVRPGATVTLDGVLTDIDDRLARYKRPKDLIVADVLPRNPGGKIDKRALRRNDPVITGASS